jgi:hypothetical protein
MLTWQVDASHVLLVHAPSNVAVVALLTVAFQ